MIHKILNIQNCGKFINYTPSESKFGWNGIFEKINTIYAENGSGKTTFTQILKSLSGKYGELVEKRHSIQTTEPIQVSLLDDKNTEYKFCVESQWNKNINNIEVYDGYYIESNELIIDLGTRTEPSDFFDIIPEAQSILVEIKKNYQEKLSTSSEFRSIRSKRRKVSSLNENLNIAERYNEIKIERNEINKQLRENTKKLDILLRDAEKKYIDLINKYLKKFNPSLELIKTKRYGRKSKQSIHYDIKINGVRTGSESTEIPLKHTLSEGDKSSLSLSFYLARLELLPNLNNRIVVFDDPISSFDTRRRRTTISILSKFARQCKQFFLLSHDLNFVKDFYDENMNALNLEIKWYQGSSVFVKQDIKLETMTGITKDIYTLSNYLKNGVLSDGEKRDVIRCIRPVIEGIFRVKYFLLLNDKEWLGDFLAKIRDCDEKSPLYRLKEYHDELSEINDYCKQYHHSNPKYLECPIYDEELKDYVERTLDIIQYI